MRRDAKTLVHDYIDQVLNRRDVDALPTYVNYDPLQKAAVGILTGSHDLKIEIEHLVAEGDIVAARVRGSGTHTGVWRQMEPTGRQWRAAGNHFFRVEDDRIVQSWLSWDWLSIMDQLGTGTKIS